MPTKSPTNCELGSTTGTRFEVLLAEEPSECRSTSSPAYLGLRPRSRPWIPRRGVQDWTFPRERSTLSRPPVVDRHRIVTDGVRSSACSRVKAASRPGRAGRGSRERCSLHTEGTEFPRNSRDRRSRSLTKDAPRFSNDFDRTEYRSISPRRGIQPARYRHSRPTRGPGRGGVVRSRLRICHHVRSHGEAVVPSKTAFLGVGTPVTPSTVTCGTKLMGVSLTLLRCLSASRTAPLLEGGALPRLSGNPITLLQIRVS